MKYDEFEFILIQINSLIGSDGKLLKSAIKEKALKYDAELIKILHSDKKSKDEFFLNLDGIEVFEYRKFIDFIDDKNFLLDSYTKFSNKIGLSISSKSVKQIDSVVLSFPFKDCVLKGDQSKDDDKSKEIFFQ